MTRSTRYPIELANDSSGNVYVLDDAGDWLRPRRIRKIDSSVTVRGIFMKKAR